MADFGQAFVRGQSQVWPNRFGPIQCGTALPPPVPHLPQTPTHPPPHAHRHHEFGQSLFCVRCVVWWGACSRFSWVRPIWVLPWTPSTGPPNISLVMGFFSLNFGPDVHISGLPSKFHERTPRKRRKKENCGGRGKKARNFGSPPIRAHPSSLHPPPFGAPRFGAHPVGSNPCPPRRTGAERRGSSWPSSNWPKSNWPKSSALSGFDRVGGGRDTVVARPFAASLLNLRVGGGSDGNVPSALQTPPKFHEKTPRERQKERAKMGGKKSEILGPTVRGPTLVALPSCPPHFLGPGPTLHPSSSFSAGHWAPP